MSCNLHRDPCPTSCRNWAPCDEPCDHEECDEVRDFGAWLDGEVPTYLNRPHVLSGDCWCKPLVMPA